MSRKEIKFTLKNFDSVIYTEEHIQEVRYRYSIDDSMCLLEIFFNNSRRGRSSRIFCTSY